MWATVAHWITREATSSPGLSRSWSRLMPEQYSHLWVSSGRTLAKKMKMYRRQAALGYNSNCLQVWIPSWGVPMCRDILFWSLKQNLSCCKIPLTLSSNPPNVLCQKQGFERTTTADMGRKSSVWLAGFGMWYGVVHCILFAATHKAAVLQILALLGM